MMKETEEINRRIDRLEEMGYLLHMTVINLIANNNQTAPSVLKTLQGLAKDMYEEQAAAKGDQDE